jgi:predicted ATPase/DNA-binding SARP family transcriptional activator
VSQLALYLLGTPRLERSGVSISLERRKALALLAYLALTQQLQRRDYLAALLWPGYDSTSARANLRRTLSVLKQAVGNDWLQADRETVTLVPDDDFWLDVDRFHQHIASCTTHGHPVHEVCADCLEALGQAVALYRDDLMTGFTLPDSPEFDEWQLFQTESLRRELVEALEKLVRGHGAGGNFELAIGFARRWLSLDPLDESAHRHLMWLLTVSGRRNAALLQYDTCRGILADELGVEPSAETAALFQQIRQDELDTEVVAPTWRPTGPPSSRHNLPTQLTPFIGRKAELAEITSLLVTEPNCRLLTLVGSGGSGKTRLALQVALDLVSSFAQGVYLVSLVAASTVDSVISAIAAALNLQLTGEYPRQQLLNYLRKRELLLVLDNFEQLIPVGATDLLSELVLTAPRLKVLVTSRERLNLQEEWGFEVQGMRFPPGDASEMGPLKSYGAIQLFLQRARRFRPDFALSDENAVDVVRICQLVEGMPLAIELAVTWLRMMSCRDIVEETERSLDFLTTSLRDVPQRHHSLRAVFEHSWRLLSNDEQTVMQRLAIFRGGFRRRAAEQVADASLLLLSALVDKSFLRRTRSGRYQIHELLRQYAAEKLNDSPTEWERTQDRHADYYLAFLRQRADELKGPHGRVAFLEISSDIDNVLEAWNRAITQKSFAILGKSAEGLLTFSDYGGEPSEGLAVLRRARQEMEWKRRGEAGDQGAASDLIMAQLLRAEGSLAHFLSRVSEGKELLHTSIALLRQGVLVSEKDLALSLYWLSHICWTQGQYGEVEQHTQESLVLFTKLGDSWGTGVVLNNQGMLATYRGEYARAQQLFLKCIWHLEERGEINYRANATAFLGIIARLRGEYAQAQKHIGEALQAMRAFGDPAHAAYALRELGYLAIAKGDYLQAEASMREGAEIFRELDMRHALVFPLDGLGTVARLQGRYQEAEELHRESLAICQELEERRGIALCLHNLGLLAYDLDDYAVAEETLRESLVRYEAIGHRYGVASALCHLGYVLCAAKGDRRAEAGDKLQQALAIALEIDARPVTLNVLVALATLLGTAPTESSNLAQAVELSTQALHHPAGEWETKERARRLLDQLASRLSPEALAAAQERGAARRLDADLLENVEYWR